jgi:hypothetical protein
MLTRYRKSLLYLVPVSTLVLAASLASFTSLAAQKGSAWVWDGVPRIVAMSDVHGNIDKLTTLLKGTGIVDAELSWSGGNAHLVLCGDLVDRGPADRAVLDLLRRLQKDAEAKRGKVHTLLGNHDIMNLARDFRFVTTESYAEFAADESPEDRKKAWEGFNEATADQGVEEDQLRASFDERYPPGYFARIRAFGEDGEYGSWLLEQPAVVKINGVVFVHGGLTEKVAALGIDEISRQVQESVRAVMRSSEALEYLVIGPATYLDFYDAADMVQQAVAEGRSVPERTASAAEELLKQADGLAFVSEGPIWYRGNSLANERVERYRLNEVLRLLDARAIMVGHTVTKSGRPTSRFNRRLYRGDVGMGHGSAPFALVFEEDKVLAYDPATDKLSPPWVEPSQGEGWSRAEQHLPDTQLEEFLRGAEVKKCSEVLRGTQRVDVCDLEGEGLKLLAVFKDVDESSQEPAGAQSVPPARYQHEVAAYWLDRRLGLGFVPVVVIRSLNGRIGALRPVHESAEDLVSIKRYADMEGLGREEIVQTMAELYALDPSELKKQVAKAWVFDALVDIRDRKDYNKLLLPSEGRPRIVDHERAFSTSTEIKAFLPNPCVLSPGLDHALRSLNPRDLESNLGEYLSEVQIKALLLRRDKILESCRVLS